MSQRDTGTKGTNDGTMTADVSGASTANALEQRVVAFAEQLRRIAGTVQAKAEGWMDRETLNEQIASVRNGATDLLKQLAEGTTNVSKKKPSAAATRGTNKGRSGGRVDAPGKKHRKRMPTDPRARIADSQAAKMRTAKTMQKTNRRLGAAKPLDRRHRHRRGRGTYDARVQTTSGIPSRAPEGEVQMLSGRRRASTS